MLCSVDGVDETSLSVVLVRDVLVTDLAYKGVSASSGCLVDETADCAAMDDHRRVCGG